MEGDTNSGTRAGRGTSKQAMLSRQDYDIMRDVLQEKVSKLGQNLDHMLDALEDEMIPYQKFG